MLQVARGAVDGGGMALFVGYNISAGCFVDVAGAAIILEPEPNELVSARYVTWGIFVSINGSVSALLLSRLLGWRLAVWGAMAAWLLTFRDIDLFSYRNVKEL